MITVVLVAITLISFVILFKMIRGPKLALVLMIPGFAALIMGWSFLFFAHDLSLNMPDGPGSSVWNSEYAENGVWIFAWTSISMIMGTATVTNKQNQRSARRNWTSSPRFRLSKIRYSGFVCLLGYMFLLLFIAIYGLHNIMDRERYNAARAIPELASFAAPLLPAAVVLLALAYVDSQSLVRAFSGLGIIFIYIITLGTTSRMLALLPVLVYAVAVLKGRRLRLFPFMITIGLAFWGSNAVLALRNGENHGLISYIGRIHSEKLGLSTDGAVESFSNVLFAVPLSGVTSASPGFGLKELLISVDPGFSGSSGWATISSDLRVHQYVPFSGIGELAAFSPVLLVLFMFALAAVITRIAFWSLNANKQSLLVVLAGMYFLIFILLLQYNLRSSMRVIYVSILVYGIYRLWTFLWRGTKRQFATKYN